MRIILLFKCLFVSILISAQTFTEVVDFDLFERVDVGSIAFADVNGDNYQDVLITGRNNSDAPSSKLYMNDGNGNFTEMSGTPFVDVFDSSIAFADVNSDDHLDVFITGMDNSNSPISKLYINDGSGNFTEMTNTLFEGVYSSSIAFADVNGDNHQDVLITGTNSSNIPISKLYINDGVSIFTEMTNIPFEGVTDGSIAFADVNSDNHQDVLISGMNGSSSRISILYTNDGSGNFIEMIGTPFEDVSESSVAFADVNGDGDQDLLITGRGDFNLPVSKLYTNDGNGNFTEVINTPFKNVAQSSIAFADINGDDHLDVLITGSDIAVQMTRLYTNDGEGNFTEKINDSFEGIDRSSIAFADVNGDNHQDVLITGQKCFKTPISKLFINDGEGLFSPVSNLPLAGVAFGSVAFADVNGDLYQDVLITGVNGYTGITSLYINQGQNSYVEITDTPFEGVRYSSVAFADVDGDNDQDVLIVGRTNSNIHISKLYMNDGSGNFTEKLDTPFDIANNHSFAFADVNGDNHLDVLISVISTANPKTSRLYINDGIGNFTEMVVTAFDGVVASSIAFADVNGDHHQDVLITGKNSSDSLISKLYINDGEGFFTEMHNTPFEGVGTSSIAFADVDGDADQDVLITGRKKSFDAFTSMYINDGEGNFTEIEDNPFIDVYGGSIAFADVDGDTDQDVLITGTNDLIPYNTKLYLNDGFGKFTENTDVDFADVHISSVAFVDINNDDLEDVFISGFNNECTISKLYINEGTVSSKIDLIIGSNLDFKLFPNPTVESNMNISFNSPKSSIVTLRLYDLNGTLIREQKEFVFEGKQTLSIDIAYLNQGMYFIKLDDGKRNSTSKFIIK